MIYDFITIGGATQDTSFFTDEGVLLNNSRDVLRQKLLAFEYGAKIRVDKFHHTFGGGGTNTAVVLANLGLRTACLTSVGADEVGKEIISNLNAHKIKTGLVKQNKGEQSGFSFVIISEKGERVIFTHRGANMKLVINKKDLLKLKQSKNIYIASLSGQWEANLRKIFSVTGPRIYWNPSETQYSAGLKKLSSFLKKTNVLYLNKDEAIEMVLSDGKYKKATNRFLNDANNLLRIIQSYGPEIVVITSGKQGVDVYDGNKFYHRNVIKEKKRVDTTGIGDCFNASFAAGLELYNKKIDKALSLALKNSASKVAHFGAQNGLIKLKK